MINYYNVTSDFPGVLHSRVLGTSMGFLGVPLTELGTRLIFLCPLSKLCVSDAHLCKREKHDITTLLL